MKTNMLILWGSLSLIASCVRADTVWDSGHHEINWGDAYWEIYMYNGATADMFGGGVYKMETFDISSFDMFDGAMDILNVHGSSIISIHGGTLGALGAEDNSLVNLYAYDVIYHPTGGHYDRGWLEGTYIAGNLYFVYDLIHTDSFSHVNVIPEPATFLLFGVGGMLLRKQRCYR